MTESTAKKSPAYAKRDVIEIYNLPKEVIENRFKEFHQLTWFEI